MLQIFCLLVLSFTDIRSVCLGPAPVDPGYPKQGRSQRLKRDRPGADCGSDHELLVTKFRLKLKKIRKTTRPFRYDLNQIPYDYTVEVRNRFKGLDLIDGVPDELWNEVRDIVQGSRPSP